MADERDNGETAPADGGGVATLAPEAPVRKPLQFDRLDEKVGKQGRWTSLLATALIVAAGGAFLYCCAYYFSIERIVKRPEPAQIALAPEEDGEAEGKKGTAYDVGDIDAELQNQEFEPPSDVPPPDLVADLLQVIDQTDFTDPNRDGNSGGGTEGGAGGLGNKGTGIGKGGRTRAQRWHIEYGTGDKRQYGKILDFFQIKLAAFRGAKCQASEGFGSGAAVKRYDQPPANLYFLLQDAARLQTDREFLQKAGIDNGPQDIVCQYFPDALAAQLLAKELAFAKRKESEIATTRFAIRPQGDNTFEIVVTEQIPL